MSMKFYHRLTYLYQTIYFCLVIKPVLFEGVLEGFVFVVCDEV